MTGVMSTPMPSPSMNGTIGWSGAGWPGTSFSPPSGTRIGLVVLLIRDGTLPCRAREAGPVREDDGLSAVAEAELVEDLRQLGGHVGLAQGQRRGDLAVREPFGDERQGA